MKPEETHEIEYSKGERFREEADRWIEANPRAWEYMVCQAEASARAKRRFSIGSLCEHVRWHMFAKGVTSFVLNNNHRAAFARRLIKEVPECEPYISTRHSVLDMIQSDGCQ